MRVFVVVVMLLLAVSAPAANVRLALGDEIPIGTAEIGPWPGQGSRPSIASDGDRVLVAWSGGPPSGWSALYAVLLDREGTLLTPAPLLLLPPSEAGWSPRVLWCSGHYVVFYLGPDSHLHALRLSPEGGVAARVDLSAFGWMQSFNVATDGEEIVVVTPGAELFRLTPALEELPAIPTAETNAIRDVAFGGGRFAVVTVRPYDVVAQFLDDGALTPPVRIAHAKSAYQSAGPSVDVKWTGTTFVAAWTECAQKTCLGWWTPLDASGAAAILPVTIGYLSYESGTYGGEGIRVVPLDTGTVLAEWDPSSFSKAYGRRFRIDGEPLDREPLELGTAGVDAFVTAHGLLLTVDRNIQLTVTRTPATAPLTSPLPQVPIAFTTANEYVKGSAASATEVAILRLAYRENLIDAFVTITSRDGRVLRHIRVEPGTGAIASDGREFYLAFVENEGIENRPRLWLRSLDGTWRLRVETGDSPGGARLVSTGSELVATWWDWRDNQGGIRMQRFSRDGGALAPSRTFDGAVGSEVRLAAHGDGLLLAWHDENYVLWTTRVDKDGNPIAAPQMIRKPAKVTSMVSNGTLNAVAYNASGDAGVALRDGDGAYAHVTLPKRGAGSFNQHPVAAVTGRFLFALYDSLPQFGGSPSVQAVLFDGNGTIEDVQEIASLVSYSEFKALIPIDENAVLAVYDRYTIEPPHLGTWRTHARVLSVAPSHGRRRSAGH